MTETYTYNATTISTIRDGTISFTQCAQSGQVGSGRVVIDDEAGTQSIVGQKDFSATQAFCSFTKTFNGYVADRIYSRGEYSPKVGASRSIDIALQDQNAMLGFDLIYPYVGSTDLLAGIRPSETVAARMAWLMASPYVPFADHGRIASSTNLMDPTDYRHQYAGDVVGECALAAGGFNFYIRDFGAGAELIFRDDNASTADTSTLRISNVLSDASAVTVYAFKDWTLHRDPSDVYSTGGLNYAKGAANLGRAATAAAFNGQRGGVISNSNITTPTEALAALAKALFAHSTERDILEGTVQLTAAQVNLIMHGDRISAKFSHYATEGYGTFNWFRVLERTVHPITVDGSLYDVHLKLSPQEAPCADSVLPTFVQANLDDSGGTVQSPLYTYTFDFTAATVIGDLLIAAVMSGGTIDSSVVAAPAGWSWAVQNERNQSGGLGQWCNVFYKTSTGESSITVQFASPGGSYRIALSEHAGLSNAALVGSATLNLQDPGVGSATVPAIAYPAGPAAVVAISFMTDGPTGSDNLAASGTSMTLRTPIAAALHGAAEVAIADMLRDSTAGSTALYPAAGGWRFLFTGGGSTLSVGLAFEGGDCGEAVIAEPPPAPPGDVVPGSAPGGTVVGLAMGGWNAPADAKSAVDYVSVATPNTGGENAHVANYLAGGLGVVVVRVGPYGNGVSSINAASWAAAAVAAYAANPTITAIEILNEPGGSWFWGSNAESQANATAYAALLSTVRSAFTSHGSAPLLLASYDGGHPGGTTWGSRMVTGDAAVWSYVDGVTVHPYGGTSNPTASALGNRTAVLAAAATTGKPVWITEVGWPTAHAQSATGDSLQWTEAQQADNVYGLVNWALGQSVVAGVILFMYEDYGTNAFYGVVRGPSNPDGAQGTHKKSFEDLRRAAHGLVQS